MIQLKWGARLPRAAFGDGDQRSRAEAGIVEKKVETTQAHDG